MSDPSSNSAPGVRRLWSTPLLSRVVCLTVANGAALLLIRLLTHRTPVQTQWFLQVLAALAMLLSSLFVAIHQRVYWHLPTRRLSELLPLVRRGEAAIEELSDIKGGPAPLVHEIQECLRDLRRQRAESEAEMRQRLANRTDALERSLGVMRHQAARDALTGLLNRRALDEALPRLVDRCRRASTPLSVLMTDVDNFKPLNDTLGHAAGDDLLRTLGQLIRSTLRDTDLAFRYGGDEFVMLLDNTTRDQADAIAQRLTALVDAMAKPLKVPHPPRLSIGVLCLDECPTLNAAAFLEQADRLLYEMKAARKGSRARVA